MSWHPDMDTAHRTPGAADETIHTLDLLLTKLRILRRAYAQRRTMLDPKMQEIALLLRVEAMVKGQIAQRLPAPTGPGWIVWEGGCCPLDAATPCEAQLRDGSVAHPARARQLNWQHRGSPQDVMRYRIRKLDNPRPTR